MKSIKIKSYCKINLCLKVIKKLSNGYHDISSLITFCNLHDVISISKVKNLSDKITFSGKFKGGINYNSNTVVKVLNLLRKNNFLLNQSFKINIQKNIPHGSGLGGASSNAAVLLNYFNKRMNLKISKKKLMKLATQIGFDVPISLEKRNTFLTGRKGKIIRLNQRFGFNILIVYPNLICSTEKIYRKNREKSPIIDDLFFRKKGKQLIDSLIKRNNDLEKIVVKIYPKIGKIINYIKSQKGCFFSRITGSGSACIGIFCNISDANYAQKMIKLKYPKYWCSVSKTI